MICYLRETTSPSVSALLLLLENCKVVLL